MNQPLSEDNLSSVLCSLSSGPWAMLPAALTDLLQKMSTPNGQTPPVLAPIATSLGAGGGDAHSASDYSLRDGVAVIQVSGPIMRQGRTMWWGGKVEGQDRIAAALAAANADWQVKAVLLSIDSPGGIAAGTQELAHAISGVAAKKPVYAYADGLCASAAYWLAAATGKVYAPPTGTIGSIGVVAVHCDYSALNERFGLRYTYLTGGKWKAVGNEDTPLSDEDKSYLGGQIAQLHAIFRGDVAARMPVDAANPEAWGDGQTFIAADALDRGLITGIVASRDELIDLIKKEINMNKEELAAKFPDLLTQIQTEARSEAMAEAEKQTADKLAAQNDACLAMVKAVAGDEVCAQVKALLDTGCTAAQIAALAPMLGGRKTENGGQKTEAGADANSRAEILAGIKQATPTALATGKLPAANNPINATIERISSI